MSDIEVQELQKTIEKKTQSLYNINSMSQISNFLCGVTMGAGLPLAITYQASLPVVATGYTIGLVAFGGISVLCTVREDILQKQLFELHQKLGRAQR